MKTTEIGGTKSKNYRTLDSLKHNYNVEKESKHNTGSHNYSDAYRKYYLRHMETFSMNNVYRFDESAHGLNIDWGVLTQTKF